MNVVAISGGLGNQMFQYAFGQLMHRRTGEEIAYDPSTFVIRRRRRSYGLGELMCEPRLLGVREARRLYRVNPLLRFFGCRPRLEYIPEEDLRGCSFDRLADWRNVYLEGYFQDPDCCLEIRDRLLEEFTLRSPTDEFRRKTEEFAACESVAVHVRRGDYVGLGLTDCCPPDYYRRAFEVLNGEVQGARYFVFSDDIAWARENLAFLSPAEFVAPLDPGRPALDMMLMKSCRHNIIANSTFSWWSAFLNDNPDKIVVAPAKWSMSVPQKDKCPREWKRV